MENKPDALSALGIPYRSLPGRPLPAKFFSDLRGFPVP